MNLEAWAEGLKLNPNSETTQQLYAHRTLAVEQYVSQFRKGRLREVLPTEARLMSVEEALRRSFIGGVNVRKLLTDTRDKFVK